MHKLVFLISVLLLFHNFLLAQNQVAIDSLLEVLTSDISNQKKVDVYVKIAEEYRYSDSLTTANYAEKAIQLAGEIDYPEGRLDAIYVIAWVTMVMGHYPEAETLLKQLIQDAASIDYLLGKAKGLNGLGRAGELKGHFTKALEYHFESLKIKEKLQDKQEMARSNNNIGIVYQNQDKFEKALEYYFKSLHYNKSLNNKKSIAANYVNIATAYDDLEQYGKALEYHFKSLEIYEALDHTYGIAFNYFWMGNGYFKQKNYEKALEYALKALALYESIGAQADIAACLGLVGQIYQQQGQTSPAWKYLRKALRLAQETSSAEVLRDAALSLSLLERDLGNYQAAYEAHVLYTQMADSLQNDEITSRITRLEAEFEFQQEKDSLQVLNQTERIVLEKDIQNRKKTQVTTFIVLGLLASVVLILFWSFRSIRRSNALLTEKTTALERANREILCQKEEILLQNTQLQELNALKDRFFSIVAHDLRGPIGTLQSLLMVFDGDHELSQEEMKQYLERMSNNVEGVANLLHNLLYWARSQMQGALPLTPKPLELQPYLQEIVSLFTETALKKSIHTTLKVSGQLPKVYADPEILRFLLRNLMDNAYKFSPVGGEVFITVMERDDDTLKVLVKDAGMGMDKATKEGLFKGFTKSQLGTLSEKGTGLGLMLCKEFVEKSGGSIGVESTPQTGSVFWFTLPVAQNIQDEEL